MSGSNQVFANSTRRYFPKKKVNLYRMIADVVVPEATPFPLQFNTTTQDQIGAGLIYVGGFFRVADESAVGLYTFDTLVTWDPNSSNFRELYYRKNAEVPKRSLSLVHGLTGSVTTNLASATINMRLGDTVFLFVNQDRGGGTPLNILGQTADAVNFSNMTVTLLQ